MCGGDALWETLRSNARQFHLDDGKFERLHDFFRQLEPETFRRFSAAATAAFPMEEAARRFSGADLPKLLLLCIVANCGFIREKYRTERWPQPMLDEILRDLRTWQDTLEGDLGGYGLTPRIFGWCADCLTGKVKSFGRLQGNSIHAFQPRKSIYRRPDGSLLVKECGDGGKPDLTYQDKVINIHIPASGRLDHGECLASLKRMRDFSAGFQPDYDYRAFVCYSWLLDPVFRRFLKPDSNIVRFQELGHLFNLEDHFEDSEVRWRLWGAQGNALPLDRLPVRNSMERGVVQTLQSGGHFREGVLILFKDELPALLDRG